MSESRDMSSGQKCNSRHLSWLTKSCFPNPNDQQQQPHLRRTNPPPPGQNSPISYLPDDLLLDCLSRVSSSSLPSLPLVCRRWSHLLLSPSFLHLRQLRFPSRPTLFSFLPSSSQFATLRLNHDSSWNLIPLTLPPHSICTNVRLLVLGPRIYMIGRTSMFGFNTWTRTVRVRSATVYSRKKFAAAVVSGKIYVAGGAARTSAVEEYDPKSDAWTVVSDAPRRRYGCVGTSVEGVFYIIGGLRIGLDDGIEGHNVYASSMDLYDVENASWQRSRAVPGGGCIVAACSVEGHVYILASHAVELSFWRFDGRRKGGGNFGEWLRLKSPPLRAQVRLDSTARYSSTGVGNKVVVLQATRSVEDIAVRIGRRDGINAGAREVSVMVYDCDGEEWSRGPNISDVNSQANCVCVEC